MNAVCRHPMPAPLPTGYLALSRVERDDMDVLNLAYEAGLLPECRRSPRRKISVPVQAIPIDCYGTPSGKPFVAESLNISATGICFTTTEPMRVKHLLVAVSGIRPDAEPVPMEVLRCTRKNDHYEVAGPFVSLPAPIPGAEVVRRLRA